MRVTPPPSGSVSGPGSMRYVTRFDTTAGGGSFVQRYFHHLAIPRFPSDVVKRLVRYYRFEGKAPKKKAEDLRGREASGGGGAAAGRLVDSAPPLPAQPHQRRQQEGHLEAETARSMVNL